MAFCSQIDENKILYTYDGSFYGLLTVIHTAVYSKTVPFGISPEHALQLALDVRCIFVETDASKASAVHKAIYKYIGDAGAKRLFKVFLSNSPKKDILIYDYLMLGIRHGTRINGALANDTVLAACKLAENVSRETEKFRQFTRFSVMDWGVQYARITPNNNILPALTPFFTARLKSIPFIIHDLTHELCAVYNVKQWYITSSQGLISPEISEDEKEIRRLWKNFFDAIVIKERENKALQKQNMPCRYFRDVWAL